MKKLLFLTLTASLLLIPVFANATITGSCTVNAASTATSGSPASVSGVAPFNVYIDCSASTSTIVPTFTATTGTGTNSMAISAVSQGDVFIGDLGNIFTGSASGTITGQTGVAHIIGLDTFNGISGNVLLDTAAATWANPTTITETGNAIYFFSHLKYEANYGDNALASAAGGTSWPYGAIANQSRNYDVAPMLDHIYETPGSYITYIRITDANGTVGQTLQVNVTVTDPNTVFSTNTACVAATTLPVAGVGGCPAGAALAINVSSLGTKTFSGALTNALGANACGAATPCRRILFKRGDSFTDSTAYALTTIGPGIIGAYGTGAAPAISHTANVGGGYFSITTGVDWTWMDLAFTGLSTNSNSKLFSLDTTWASPHYFAALRINASLYLGYVMSATGVGAPFVTAQDCTFGQYSTGAGSPAGIFYVGPGPLISQGNDVEIYQSGANGQGFGTRINPTTIPMTGGIIAHNLMGSGGNDTMAFRGNEQLISIHDNKFFTTLSSSLAGMTTTTDIWVGPQNLTSREDQFGNLFERNWDMGGSRTGGMGSGGVGGSWWTVRNNVFDQSHKDQNGTLSGNSIENGYTNQAGAAISRGNAYQHNTFFNSGIGTSGSAATGYSGVRIIAPSATTIVPTAAGGPGAIVSIDHITGTVNPGVGATLSGGGLTPSTKVIITSCTPSTDTITPTAGGTGATFTILSHTGTSWPALGATLSGGGMTGTALVSTCSNSPNGCSTGTITMAASKTIDGTAITVTQPYCAGGTITFAPSVTSWSGAAITVTNKTVGTMVKQNLAYAPLATHDAGGAGSAATIIADGGSLTVGAQNTFGNSPDSSVGLPSPVNPFTLATPTTILDYRIPQASYGANMTNTNAATIFPATFDDLLHCKDVTSTNKRAGAMVPAANARCSGVAK